MPIPIPFPLINGFRFDYSSIEIKVGAKIILGVKEISYNQSLKPGYVRGTRSMKAGRTRGQLESEASMMLYKLEADELITTLIALGGGRGYMEVPFDICVHYADFGAPVVTDFIDGVRITKDDTSNAEGSEAIGSKFDLDPMLIRPGGKLPVSARQVGR